MAIAVSQLVQDGKFTHQMELSSDFKVPYINGYYGDVPVAPYSSELNAKLAALGNQHHFEHYARCEAAECRLMGAATDYERYLLGLDDFLFQLVTHEGFHINDQGPEELHLPGILYSWPSWVRLPDRARMPSTCYNPNDEIRALATKEMQAALSALKLAWFFDQLRACEIRSPRLRFDPGAEVCKARTRSPFRCQEIRVGSLAEKRSPTGS